ncbi:conserved Plasmodium protein, unknown function [Plasmodium ovale]|uniref:Uncharacterized protein n=2 Tax=Plasmodium ovale TaxID=36330 RepID=A0A1A8WVT0_PLAOA|nr:conserved Plasmodium protein, unknown function [Plasmodium ovale curtisi]SBS97077.1 conserved Plasmodium protein, unknown function [Plasmodium ovale curtisi]SCP05784.1 conserved Plasmodium protein, unknown function [Plasmodium ovale]
MSKRGVRGNSRGYDDAFQRDTENDASRTFQGDTEHDVARTIQSNTEHDVACTAKRDDERVYEYVSRNTYDNFNTNVHINTNVNNESSDGSSNESDGSSNSEQANGSAGKNKSKCKKKKNTENKDLKNDDDIKQAVKIALQFILKNQPFPIKREELTSIINMYVPNCNSKTKRKIIFKHLKRQVNDILALKLLTLNTKTKTEYVLTQSITYKQHNDFLFSHLDHNIRGFLLFLLPFFKVFHNKIPLNYLLYQLGNVGYKTSKTKEEIIKIVNSPKISANSVNNIVYTSKDLVDPFDYIVYSKKLAYIDFINDQYDENSLDGFYCIPTVRFECEMNTKEYIKELLNIPDKTFQLKDLYVMFDESDFVNLNYDLL